MLKLQSLLSFLLISIVATFAASSAQATPPCPPPPNGVGAVLNQTQQLRAALQGLSPTEVAGRAALANAIGHCAINPLITLDNARTQLPLSQFNPSDAPNVYDGIVRPTTISSWNANHARFASVRRRTAGGATALTQEDFIAIDVFARTLYQEMSSTACNRQPGNMEAVARVMINRGMHTNRAEFRDGTFRNTNMLTRALLADSAFSVWNSPREGGHAEIIYKASCPTPANPNPLEQDAWNRARAVALHAYLDRESFLRETHSLQTVLFYTSGIRMRGNFTERTGARLPVYPFPNGRVLNNPTCLRFWDSNNHD